MSLFDEELAMRRKQIRAQLYAAQESADAAMDYMQHRETEKAIEAMREAIYFAEGASLIGKSNADARQAEGLRNQRLGQCRHPLSMEIEGD